MNTSVQKECEEMMIFRAFTENERFLDVCKAVREFDRTHPERKILRKTSDKDILKKCFNECRQAVDVAFSRGEKPDFADKKCVNRLKDAFNQQLPMVCRKSHGDFSSPLSGQIGMGKIFFEHMDYIKRAGLKYYNQLASEQKREDEKRSREQVTVNSYRRLGESYGDRKVFSEKNTYKTSREAVLSRMFGGNGGR